MTGGITDFGQRVYRGLTGRRQRAAAERQRERVAQILADPRPPRHYDSEDVVRQLQTTHKPPPEYGYDAYNTWARGMKRAVQNIPLHKALEQPGARVLDAACGDGMTGFAFATYGHDVTLHDLEDWRDARAKHLPFVCGGLSTRLPIDDNQFDAVFSFNAFEHFDDPAAALAQLVRVCRPGGALHFDFGPLYASPHGLHAYRSLYMPYPQFLFSEPFLEAKLKEFGLWDLGRARSTLQPLNRWTVAQFEKLFRGSGCEVVTLSTREERGHLGVIEQHPDAFTGRGLTFADVTVYQMLVILKKPVGKGVV